MWREDHTAGLGAQKRFLTFQFGAPVVMRVLPLHPDEDSPMSEEEQSPLVLDQTWRGDPESEGDSIDSDHEDPLK